MSREGKSPLAGRCNAAGFGVRLERLSLAGVLVLGVSLAVAACGESVGACEGWSDVLNNAYCQDNFSKSECQEWDDLGVNGADWYFHAGQTCAERGFARASLEGGDQFAALTWDELVNLLRWDPQPGDAGISADGEATTQ
ncbi:MAG: hypothetical protein GTN62_02210 [Gemmatimonadales bacterium]|nr:hypothetical protein [Gemmatimonadales bacterium]NIN12376.1 hypothetical protein [Gemmatimonadales bacterium]NIN48914.1 hypothetical protein [Gemmatimonadales bacterium]NIP06378.1 hypothetical protein [Gemmatimonadales bacterium]NIR00751.1 hypothetical protein [Gemmatimonadales bacterium]